jgi:hypothetical protein
VRIPPAPHLARGAEAALLQPVARLWNWLCRSNEMTRLNRYMLCDIGLPPEASAHAPPWLDGA